MGIPDVDLDIADRDAVLKMFPYALRASQLSADGDTLIPHNTGVYFQSLPQDPLTELPTFHYKQAEELGYYKVDFIPFNVYQSIRDEAHLLDLVEFAESDNFPWDWFQEERFFDGSLGDRITHLGNHFSLCQQYPPGTVAEVAALIALIRPRKKYLIGEHWNSIVDKIWKKLPEEDSDTRGAYFFKKSHAIGYALVVLVHMQLLDQIRKNEPSTQ